MTAKTVPQGLERTRAEAMYRVPRLSAAHVSARVHEAVGRIRANHAVDQKGAVAWSGGKDGMAAWIVAREAGIDQGVLGIAPELEFPSYMRFLEAHKPAGVTVIERPYDLAWLAAHPEYIFPTDSRHIIGWTRAKQLRAQEEYCAREGVDVLVTGRRRADANCSVNEGVHTKKGVTILDPLFDWSHEETLALLHYEKVELPPQYHRPYGWQVGSDHWPLLRPSRIGGQGAWAYLHEQEPEILVAAAAANIPGARAWLEAFA